MEYPIPDHLKPFFVLSEGDNSELRAEGALRCRCGSMLFVPYINDAGTIAAARCHQCGGKTLLLHAGRHGWDGFVAKAAYLYDLPTKMHPLEECPACGAHTPQGIRIVITSLGREDFIRGSELSDEDGRPLRAEDWVNAFSSFRMDTACPVCGAVTGSIIDIETA